MRNEALSERLYAERRPVEGTCPECSSTNLAEYRVNSEGGWFEVVKCQDCLCSLSRAPWRLLGPITLLADTIEGAGR